MNALPPRSNQLAPWRPALPGPVGSRPAPAGPELRTRIGRPTVTVALLGVLMLAVMLAWAAVTPIAGAVIAGGQAVVRGKPKLVQSLDGGIIASIEVAAGDRVAAGDVLLRLDPTLISANLEISRSKLADALARRARLQSEQLDLAEPGFGYPELPFAPPDTSRQEENERHIFAARAELRQGTQAQLDERRAQIGNRVSGLHDQIAAKQEQLDLVDEDLGNVTRLSEQGLARNSQRLDLARMRSDLLGQIAAFEAEIAQLANSVRDAELQALQQEREFAEGVATDLRTADAEIEALVPQILTLQTQLSRVEIRAPVDGVVHEMAKTAVGEVISPGEVILQVVPIDAGLDFEVRLDPRFVDQVHPGQATQVVLAALDPRATPKLDGRVASVSPGTLEDRATGARYYLVEVDVPPDQLARLGPDVELMPGMPIETFFETGDRTVLRYLLKPFSSQIDRAFREE